MIKDVNLTPYLVLLVLKYFHQFAEQQVQQWFINHNLQEANPVQQFHKLIEEMGELSAAITRQKSDDNKLWYNREN